MSYTFRMMRYIKLHNTPVYPYIQLDARADFKAHRSCRAGTARRIARRGRVRRHARARNARDARPRKARTVNLSRAIADRRSRDRAGNARPRDASFAAHRDATHRFRAPRAVHARQDAMTPFGDFICVPVRTIEDVGGEERDARARGEALDHEVRCVI